MKLESFGAKVYCLSQQSPVVYTTLFHLRRDGSYRERGGQSGRSPRLRAAGDRSRRQRTPACTWVEGSVRRKGGQSVGWKSAAQRCFQRLRSWPQCVRLLGKSIMQLQKAPRKTATLAVRKLYQEWKLRGHSHHRQTIRSTHFFRKDLARTWCELLLQLDQGDRNSCREGPEILSHHTQMKCF